MVVLLCWVDSRRIPQSDIPIDSRRPAVLSIICTGEKEWNVLAVLTWPNQHVLRDLALPQFKVKEYKLFGCQFK